MEIKITLDGDLNKTVVSLKRIQRALLPITVDIESLLQESPAAKDLTIEIMEHLRRLHSALLNTEIKVRKLSKIHAAHIRVIESQNES